MLNTLKTIVSVVTLVTSVIIAVVELKKALEQFRKKNIESSGNSRPAIVQVD